MARMKKLQDVFARNLKERRRNLALTQAQLASKIGVSTSFVTEIETCRKAPSFATIEKISRALDIPCWTLFCEYGDLLPTQSDGIDQFAYKLKQEISAVIDRSIQQAR